MSMENRMHRDQRATEPAQLANQGMEGMSAFHGERDDVASARLHRLDVQEIATVSGIGGAGFHGRGVLRGWLYTREQRIVLVTDSPETREEVRFTTDLHERAPLPPDGAHVAVAGVIRKLTSTSGTITRTHLVDWPDLHHMPGQYVVLTGHVETRMVYGRSGEAPPSGRWLVLPRTIHLGDLRADEVYLAAPRSFPEGYRTELHGRVALHHQDSTGTAMQPHALLTGISDLFAGEPLYDSTAFCSAADGAPLRTLVLERHEVSHDAPSTVLVLEPDQQIAYAGTVDDAHAPHASPFHGFHGQAPLLRATAADRAALRFDTHGYAYSTATGKQLCAVGHEGPAEPSPDAIYASYLFDEDSYTVYEVLSGGSAGLQNQLACVIRVPRSPAARDSRETS